MHRKKHLSRIIKNDVFTFHNFFNEMCLTYMKISKQKPILISYMTVIVSWLFSIISSITSSALYKWFFCILTDCHWAKTNFLTFECLKCNLFQSHLSFSMTTVYNVLVFRYMSKFREQVKLEKDTNKASNKTMGPAQMDIPSPEKYLLKRSKEPKLPESMYCFRCLFINIWIVIWDTFSYHIHTCRSFFCWNHPWLFQMQRCRVLWHWIFFVCYCYREILSIWRRDM